MPEATITAPPIPDELWLLWNPDDDTSDPHPPCWVVSVDDAPGGRTYLTAFTEAEAVAAAGHQAELYCVNCVPVRVK
jgi:hypothetical protein